MQCFVEGLFPPSASKQEMVDCAINFSTNKKIYPAVLSCTTCMSMKLVYNKHVTPLSSSASPHINRADIPGPVLVFPLCVKSKCPCLINCVMDRKAPFFNFMSRSRTCSSSASTGGSSLRETESCQ